MFQKEQKCLKEKLFAVKLIVFGSILIIKRCSQFGLANAKGAEINPHAMQNKTFVGRHSLADAVFPSNSIAIPGPI